MSAVFPAWLVNMLLGRSTVVVMREATGWQWKAAGREGEWETFGLILGPFDWEWWLLGGFVVVVVVMVVMMVPGAERLRHICGLCWQVCRHNGRSCEGSRNDGEDSRVGEDWCHFGNEWKIFEN